MTLKSNLPIGVYERNQEEKSYHKVLIVGGRGAQSAEINEIQQIQDAQRDRLTSSLYPEGTIISGGFASQDKDNTIHIRETRIHLKEYIFIIPATDITPNESESSTIGILLTENFIDSENTYGMKDGVIQVLTDSVNEPLEGDKELLNPVEGTANYGTKGAMRVQYLISWVSEPEANSIKENQYYYPLYTTLEGKVVVSKSKTSSEIYDTIARYDNDSNGSYVISGMNVYHSTDSGNYHLCSISEGVAHVNGYEVVFSYANPISIEKALDKFNRVSEPVSVSGSGTYHMRHSPIADVSRILITKQRNLLPFSHVSSDGIYSGSVDSLLKEVSGKIVLNTTISGAVTDNVRSITKVIGVYEDPAGATPYVLGRDYNVDGDSIDWSPSGQEPSPGGTYYVSLQYWTEDVDYEVISDDKGSRSGVRITDDHIAAGQICTIDYTHYLQRVDSVVLYSDGSTAVVKGAPSESNPMPQTVSGGLVLSTVLVRYGYEPYFYNDYYKTVKKSEILELKNAITKLQSNLAQLDLKTDLTVWDAPSTKVGMFVDPFYDDDMRDTGLEQILSSAPAEIMEQILYPKRDWQIYSVHEGKDITLPFTSVNYITQKYRTKSRFINEFVTLSSEDSPIGNMTVAPSTYRWAAKFTQVTYSYMIWGHSSSRWYGGWNEKFTDLNGVYEVPSFELKVTGSNFNRDEIVHIKVDNIEVGTTITDNTGNFSTVVNTPDGMKSGVKQVESIGAVSGCRAVSTVSTIPQEKMRYRYYYWYGDPIGQTFLNEEQCFVHSISLYFSKVPVDYVTLCLCETSSGFPDPTKIIAGKTLQKEEISTSGFTKFTFDSPVVLNANTYYAFILISNENVGEVYVAELGKRDNWNSVWMTQNVFSSGTMVQASQIYTWSAVQTEDLTFIIDRCNFEKISEEITLGNVTIPSELPVSQLYLQADSEVFENTSLDYKITLDGSAGTYTISEYNLLSLGSIYSGNIKLTATLSSSDESGKLSPKILGDIQLAGCLPVFPSDYVSRAFVTDGQYLKVYIDVFETGRQVFLKYMDTSTGVWTELDTYDGVSDLKFPPENIGDRWVRRTFYKNIGTIGANKGYIRIMITFDNISITDSIVHTDSASGDTIPNEGVYKVVSVTKTVGDTTTTYSEGTDFVVNGNSIVWTSGILNSGDVYKVTYRSTKGGALEIPACKNLRVLTSDVEF